MRESLFTIRADDEPIANDIRPENNAVTFAVVFHWLAISVEEGVVAVSCQTTPWNTYQLQYCDDLIAGDWDDLGTVVVGTGGVIAWSDHTASLSQKRFYRVRMLP